MKDSTIRMDVHLFDLPENEILLEIIGYLSPEEWLNLRLVSKQTLYLVTQFFKYMKCLDIAYYEYFPPSLCQIVTQTCQNLQVLKLSKFDRINEDDLKKILQNNHNLKHLDLSNSITTRNGVLQPLVVNCKRLHTIILRNCHWVTVGAIEVLAFHFLNLIKKADFSGCICLSEASIILFIKRQSRLESLALSSMDCVRNETLNAISQSCHNLRHLDVTNCTRITDVGMQDIEKYCRSLQSLKMLGCSKITERALTGMRSRKVQIDKPKYPIYLLLDKNDIQDRP